MVVNYHLFVLLSPYVRDVSRNLEGSARDRIPLCFCAIVHKNPTLFGFQLTVLLLKLLYGMTTHPVAHVCPCTPLLERIAVPKSFRSVLALKKCFS